MALASRPWMEVLERAHRTCSAMLEVTNASKHRLMESLPGLATHSSNKAGESIWTGTLALAVSARPVRRHWLPSRSVTAFFTSLLMEYGFDTA